MCMTMVAHEDGVTIMEGMIDNDWGQDDGERLTGDTTEAR